MEYLIFVKICENYYYLIPEDSRSESREEDTSAKKRIFKKASFLKLSDNQTIPGTELDQILQKNVQLKSDNYLFVREDIGNDYYLFVGLGKNDIRTSFFSREIKPKIQIASEAKKRVRLSVCNFRLNKRKELLSRLMSKKTRLEDCIEAFSKYSFFDRYALWIYNRHTQVFTSLVNSHELPKEYVTREDDNSLHKFLDNCNPDDYRKPNHGCVNEGFAKGMQTLNRIRLQIGNNSEDIGIMDFLSEFPNFKLRSDTQDMIKNCLEAKYLEHLEDSQTALHKIQQHFSTYEPGKIDELLYGLTQKICEELGFQACSILRKIDKGNKLEIVAITDNDHNGRPREQIIYDLAEESFTGSLYNSTKSWDFSYDISKDNRNKHIYDESTKGPGKTWLAFVLKCRTSREKWGVLRVKNKYKYDHKEQLINFTPDDIDSLNAICIYLGSIFDLEVQHLEYVKKFRELQTSFTDLRNFSNVFLHEIKTPISLFVTSPKRVIALLEKLPVDEQTKLPLRRKIEDIYVMGERLSFITTTYYFAQLTRPRKCETLFVMNDIVMPVLNISIDYIRFQFKLEILKDDIALAGQKIYGDKDLLNIAFNVLISNAAKYSPNPKFPIRIGGQLDEDGRYFSLDISNYGFRIHEDERERIFMNGKRGKEAIRYKSQGTGIGLYLAKSIMNNLHGDLVLKSNFNPVTFIMKIPTFKWKDAEGGQNG